MKTLLLVCKCGAKKLFVGETIDDLQITIDADPQGWQDQLWDVRRANKMKPGEGPGQCGECFAKEDMKDRLRSVGWKV